MHVVLAVMAAALIVGTIVSWKIAPKLPTSLGYGLMILSGITMGVASIFLFGVAVGMGMMIR